MVKLVGFCIRYKVIEILAGGGSALVEWRLETGRTHQVCTILVLIISTSL